MSGGEIASENFTHGGAETIAVGVEPVPTAVGPAKRIDGTDGTRRGIDLRDAIEGDDFVRHGEVDAVEALRVEELERARKVVGRDVEAEIFPVAEARIMRGQRAQC